MNVNGGVAPTKTVVASETLFEVLVLPFDLPEIEASPDTDPGAPFADMNLQRNEPLYRYNAGSSGHVHIEVLD